MSIEKNRLLMEQQIQKLKESVNEDNTSTPYDARRVGRIIHRGTGIDVTIDDGSLIISDMSDGQHIRVERKVGVTLLIKTLQKALKLMS